jgi:hypothetical protein
MAIAIWRVYHRHNSQRFARVKNSLARMKPTAAASPSSLSFQDPQLRLLQARFSGSSSRTGSMVTPIVLSRKRPRGSGMNRQELALLLDQALALTANVDIDSSSAKNSMGSGSFRGVRKDSDLKK